MVDLSISYKTLDEILKYKRCQTSAEEIFRLARNWSNVFKERRLKELTYEDVCSFSRVFYFKSNDLDRMRNELIFWLRNNKGFYNDNVELMCNRMQEAVDMEAEATGQVRFPYINWIPRYGGMMKIAIPKNRTQLQFIRMNNIALPCNQDE